MLDISGYPPLKCWYFLINFELCRFHDIKGVFALLLKVLHPLQSLLISFRLYLYSFLLLNLPSSIFVLLSSWLMAFSISIWSLKECENPPMSKSTLELISYISKSRYFILLRSRLTRSLFFFFVDWNVVT